MKPTIGRIVHYTLTEEDAAAINRRRTTNGAIKERMSSDRWPAGAQAHIGLPAEPGETLPAIVVKVNPDETINAQVFLNGNDTLFVGPVGEGLKGACGYWNWPQMEPREPVVTPPEPPPAPQYYTVITPEMLDGPDVQPIKPE